MLKMNKDLTISFKDALLLLNIYISQVQSFGPKKYRVSYQLVAFVLILYQGITFIEKRI